MYCKIGVTLEPKSDSFLESTVYVDLPNCLHANYFFPLNFLVQRPYLNWKTLNQKEIEMILVILQYLLLPKWQ